MINAWRERQSAQILTSQVAGDRHVFQTIVRRGVIDLRLLRDRIRLVYRSRDRDARKARDRSTRVHAQISGERRRSRISDRRGTQDSETPCRGKNTCQQQAIFQTLQRRHPRRRRTATSKLAEPGSGSGFSVQPSEIQRKHWATPQRTSSAATLTFDLPASHRQPIKKTDAHDHAQWIVRIGLLVNEPPGTARLPFS